MHRYASLFIRLRLLLIALVAPGSAFAQLDPPGGHYATWDSPTAAVQSLWDARMLYNRGWAWGTLYQNLDQTIRANIDTGSGLNAARPPQQTPNSVYLIPKVSIRSINLPRGLHHLSAALLRYNLTTAGAPFYPAYTDGDGINYVVNTALQRVGDYREVLGTLTRSRHDNDTQYLPAVATPACPAAVSTAINTAWNAGTAALPSKQRAMDALAGVALNAYTNSVKWHCFAMRATPPGVADTTVAHGYIEISHPDGTNREYSDSNNGRIVYDYVHGKVYYTPTHYRPSFRAGNALQVSENNFCPDTRTCASPFFEIVE